MRKYVQEEHARDLHRALSEEFAAGGADSRVSVRGGGVQWRCDAKRGERSCSVNCFDNQGPEYLVSFEHGVRRDAIGRTVSRAETVAAVSDWLGGRGIDDLHRQFDFVDRQARALAAIQADAVGRWPELGRLVSSEVRHVISDLCELWFRAQDRSCRVSYYGRNRRPDAVFHWDECEILRIQTADTPRLAAMLKLWLCDQAMPSEMAADFPEAEVKQVARYYEQGRPVEGEFVTSWEAIEHFYDDPRFPWAGQVLGLIAGIRQGGYDKTLRAGQSLWSLVVSRSRRHGLRAGQARLAFSFSGKGMDVDVFLDGEERLSLPRIEFSPQVEALLNRLTTRDID